MKPTNSTNQTSRVKHAGAEVANLLSVDAYEAATTGTATPKAPTILGVPCVRYVSQSPSALTRMAAQDWVWIRPDIGAVIKIWNDGTWVWEHLSGTLERSGAAGPPGASDEYVAAKQAERALIERANAILGAAKILATEVVGTVKL